MEPAKSALSAIEEWKKRIENSGQLNDPMIKMMYEGVKAMEIMLKKDSSYKDMVRALGYFNYERALSLQRDNVKSDANRDLVYGLAQCLHLVLGQLARERNGGKREDGLTQINVESIGSVLEVSVSSHENVHPVQVDQVSLPEPDFSPVENDQSVGITIKQEDQATVSGDSCPIVKEEPWNGTSFSEVMDKHLREERRHFVGFPLIIKKEPENEVTMDDIILEAPYEAPTVKKERSSSRVISKPLKYDAYVEYDEESDTDVKPKGHGSVSKKPKRRSVSKVDEGLETKKRRVSVLKKKVTNATELKCPICEYSTNSVDTWLGHLRFNHSMTPPRAGVALLCDCGHESVTASHSRECDVANFAVIRTSRNKCVLCEVYPMTACGYAQHLRLKHGSTLAANGIYLMCSCGLKVCRHKSDPDHTKKCNGRQFTIHKTNETELDATRPDYNGI